ncbi:Tectonic-3 [Manis pentadactyla]|nr:Tectonic-3 [Manis pentadactyla]
MHLDLESGNINSKLDLSRHKLGGTLVAAALLRPSLRHAPGRPGLPSRAPGAHLSLKSMAQNDSTTGDSLL